MRTAILLKMEFLIHLGTFTWKKKTKVQYGPRKILHNNEYFKFTKSACQQTNVIPV